MKRILFLTNYASPYRVRFFDELGKDAQLTVLYSDRRGTLTHRDEKWFEEGEGGFRRRETAAIADLGKRSGVVIATGGGSVLRPENYDLLHQNGTIFWLQRDWRKLPTDGRPISQTRDLSELLHERTPAYTRFADHIIDNNGTVEETLRQILEVLP